MWKKLRRAFGFSVPGAEPTNSDHLPDVYRKPRTPSPAKSASSNNGQFGPVWELTAQGLVIKSCDELDAPFGCRCEFYNSLDDCRAWNLMMSTRDTHNVPVEKLLQVSPTTDATCGRELGCVGCLCRTRGGPRACEYLNVWSSTITCAAARTGLSECVCANRGYELCQLDYQRHLRTAPIGAFTVGDFSGSPQQHAILNRHLLDYFNDRKRSQETTRYFIPAAQRHLLPKLGMEEPQPDAPVIPHGLHKSIEEFQLRRMRHYLPADYNLVCCKASKLPLLPTPATVQNPLRHVKDVTRFPGSALMDANFSVSDTHFMHDIAAEVTPHELVEKLVSENPSAHLFVTGLLPPEVIDRAQTFEPASHSIEYDQEKYAYIFTDSESESYYTPIATTLAWHYSSSVVASNGKVYHVALLDEKLGHSLYHIFCGDVEPQDSRVFSTGSLTRLPPAVTGTLRSEYLPAKLLSAVLDFVQRTPDLSTRNLAAKVTQVANATTPRTTSRERWVARHIMAQLAPIKTWDYLATNAFWSLLYAVSFQWHMFKPLPDLYSYLDERARHRRITPTEGGGWSKPILSRRRLQGIPNYPTLLQQVSAWTATAFVFLWPKLVLGEVLTLAVHLYWWSYLKTIVGWMHIDYLRLLLTAAVVVVTSVLPNRIIDFFTHMSHHYWRLLWLPAWLAWAVEEVIIQLSGAPGAIWAYTPGGGWAWQALIWAMALHSLLPGLVPALVVPWVAYTHGWHVLMTVWLGLVVLDNLLSAMSSRVFFVPSKLWRQRNHRTWQHLLEVPGRIQFGSVYMPRGNLDYRPVPFFNRLANFFFICSAACVPTLEPATTSLPEVLSNDVCDVAQLVWYSIVWTHNFLMRSVFLTQARLGNCDRVPTLRELPPLAKPAVRVRNVNKVLPTVVVQPNAPVAPLGVQVAIPSTGLTFPDWLQQLEAAYNAAPPTQPALTPGRDCFWQAVASLGGTPHMWFTWYQEFMRRQVPANQVQVGHVTLMDIHTFSAVSGIGVRIRGETDEVSVAQSGMPTLHLKLSHVPFTNDLHVEVTTAPQQTTQVADLARLLATIQRSFPNWYNAVVNAHNAAAIDALVKPTPVLKAIMGNKTWPTTVDGIAEAIVGSFDVTAFTAVAPDGYALDFVRAVGTVDPLFEYGANVTNTQVAHTSSEKFWRAARSAGKHQMKVGFTSKQQRDNAAFNNVRPEPPHWVTLANELSVKVAKYSTGILPATHLEEEVFQYTADVNRASRLVSDLKAHPAVLGGKASAAWLQSLDSVVDLWRLEGKSRTVTVRGYFGVGGCGKTTATVNYLRTLTPEQLTNVRIVSHTESLRAQAKVQLDFESLRGVNFPTLPGLLSEPSAGPVVFDDAGKFFGGVLDLLLLTNPMVPEVVVNGDPAQALTKFPVGGTQSEFDVGPMVVAQQATKYATVSHRAFGLLAESLGIHTTSSTRGHITHTISPKQGIPVTTASPRYVQVLSSAGRQAYTHDTVQGESFNCDIEVDMSALEEAASDRTAYVAITRSSTGVYLHMNAADPRSVIKQPPTGSDLMNAIIYSLKRDNLPTLLRGNDLIRATFYAHLHASMPTLKWFANVGATLPPERFALVSAVASDHVIADHSLSESLVDYDVPSTAPAETYVHETHELDKEHREVNRAGLQTNQFKECAFVNPHVHKRSDHATYKLTVEKRINNATPAANYTRMKKCPRTDMIEEFDRLVHSVSQWTPEKHSLYIDRAVREYQSGRTEAAVLAKLSAHDPDRTGEDVVNSLKAQVIKKDEKRHKVEAIPGQLIYEYDILQTLEDAAYALYLEDHVISAFPENFLFYRRLSPGEFVTLYMSRWRVNNGVHTSDVTRWDVGCDAGVLNFDRHVMERAGFPTPYVESFVKRRLCTRTQHGSLATSQPSGDRFTWAFNSIRRAVVSSLVLQVQPVDTVAINGDDAALDRCADALEFPDTVWEFKNQNGSRGEFSGFELGGERPLYSASGIHYRAMILLSKDPSARDKWVNYLDLLQFSDCDSWEALDVARMAKPHLDAETYERYVPKSLLPLV